MVVMNKLNELQENSERQYNEIRNKIYEQNEFFTRETEIIQKMHRNSRSEESNK